PHTIAIDDIDRLILAAHHGFVRESSSLVRHQQHATSAQIMVPHIQLVRIKGSKEIQHVERGVQLDHALTKVGYAIPVAVAGGQKDVSIRVRGGASGAHPYAAFAASRSNVPHRNTGQRGCIECKHETVVGLNVAIGGEGNIDVAVGKQQRTALKLLLV